MLLLPWEYAFIHPHSTSIQKMFYSYTRRRHSKISVAIISFSTYSIKLQLFQLILPTTISALKGLAVKKNKKRRKRTKVPKKKKRKQPSPSLQNREVSYPQGAIVKLDIHHQLSPHIITIILITHFIHCTHMHI